MKYIHLNITGFVQGVGYRKFVLKNARQMKLVGFVRNLPDNSVEVMVAGPQEKINELISICKKGPFLSDVKDIKVSDIESHEEFTEFLVQHDF